MAAQPFGRRKGRREPAGQPQSPPAKGIDHDTGQPPIDRHGRGKPADRERHHPQIGRRIDKEGVADPVKGQHEITQPEKPAGKECLQELPWLQAFEQHQKHRDGNEQHRPKIERRQRQCCHKPGHQGQQRAAPAGESADHLGQSNHRGATIGTCHILW